MKELHNHIFSNTTCISKETMLRYINHQLSKNELHDVEKHMLDCELCSEAYEGMQYAHNSSVLFAIDHQIDQRVASGNSKAPVIRNLMVAASVLVIIFGAYFTYDFFNKTVENENGLAINNPKNDEDLSPLEEKMKLEDADDKFIDTPNKDQINLQDEDKSIVVEQQMHSVEKMNNSFGNVSPDLSGAQDVPIDDVMMDAEMDEIESLEEEVKISGKLEKSNRTKNNEGEKHLDNLKNISNDGTVDNRREDNPNSPSVQPKTNSNSNQVALLASEKATTTNNNEPTKSKDEAKKSKNKARKVADKKDRYRANEPKSAEYAPAGGAVMQEKEFADRNQENTVTINGYKVVDYTVEYQRIYELEKSATIETKSVSPNFETKEDKDVAEAEKEEEVVEITYKETLDKAIASYKNKNYTLALEQFDIILKEHPDEINGLFYGGLSNYHLKRYRQADGKFSQVLTNNKTEFNEEAKWYKALTLIELKEIDQAKKILNEIVSGNGFYKNQASEKLKGL